MKKVLYSIVFLAMFLIVADDAMAQNCRPNANQIAVFEHSGYKGKCAVRNVGNYPSARSFGLPNDSISSVIIGQNVFAVLYEHNNYSGKKQTFSRTDTTLANNSIGNDAVSSIRVIRKNYSPPNENYRQCAIEGRRCSFRGTGTVAFGINGKFKYKRNVAGNIACNKQTFGDPFAGIAKRCYYLPQRTETSTPTAQSCRPNANQIAIFYDSNYRGRCRVRDVGNYPSARSIGLPNDSISSIVVGSNVGAMLCKDVNYKGTCETYRSNDSFLGNNSIGNDQVSSIRVFRKANRPSTSQSCRPNSNQIAVFVGTRYSGRCVTRNAGSYANARAIGLPNDTISSIRVGSNVRALVCRDINYRGSCYNINGNESNLSQRQIGQNQISSIKVIGKRTTPINRPRHSSPNSRYIPCAVEGERCNLRRRTTIAYGVNGRFVYKRNVSGSIACNNRTFGDPAPGVKKRCYYLRQNQTPQRVITGRNVGIVNYGSGTFTRSSTGKWLEYKEPNKVHATFTEIRRTQSSVFLRKSDGARIELNLRTKSVLLNGRKLFTIVSFS